MRRMALVMLVFLLAVLPGCRLNPFSWGKDNERGLASWYGNEYHGRTTASGEVFNEWGMTAAHRKLPFGTVVRVTNRKNGERVTVTINDRGPFIRGRIIDLSRGAAEEIGMVRDGVVPVDVEILRRGHG